MKIDVFAHIMSPRFKEAMSQVIGGPVPLVESVQTLFDLDLRLRITEKYDVQQVLVPSWGAGVKVSPTKEVELMKIANDEMAELVYKYPDHFVAAIAFLPTNDMDASLKEVDRAITELKFRGVLLRNPVDGRPMDRPEFMPLYEKMCDYNLPIWIHPSRPPTVPDYADEENSKYYIWMTWGWPYDTTVAMTRLVFSGVLERYPNLKFITHHSGAMVPFFAERISGMYDYAEMRQNQPFKQGLTKSPVEYFRMFYNDTAIYGNTPALMCAYDFFGPDHLLFGTDMPWDSQIGDRYTRQTIEAIEQMEITDKDKQKIFKDNARKLLRLPT